jgi:hypothetical protein
LLFGVSTSSSAGSSSEQDYDLWFRFGTIIKYLIFSREARAPCGK